MREVSFNEYLNFLFVLAADCFKKWKVLIGVFIISLLIYLVINVLRPPIYSASATFTKEYPALRIRNNTVTANSNKDFTATSIFKNDNVRELFKSKDFIEQCLIQPVQWQEVEKSLLDVYWNGDWTIAPFIKNSLPTPNSLADFDKALRITARKILDDDIISISSDPNSEYYKLTVYHENETFANAFCRVLIQSAITFHDALTKEKSSANLDRIQGIVDSVKRRLSTSIAASATTADAIINPSREVIKAGLDKKEIDARVNAGLYEEMAKQLEIARMNQSVAGPVIRIIEKPTLPLARQQLSFFAILNTAVFILGTFYLLSFVTSWDNRKMLPVND